MVGPDFDGREYRFDGIVLLTDKASYAPGETAHLMLACDQDGATVLFSHHPEGNSLVNYRLIALPQRCTVVDVPVGKGDVPNCFAEATAVYRGEVHQQSCELRVPPAEGMVRLAVEADKAEYRPGERGRIRVHAVGPDGRPVRAQVALTAYDGAVLAIQPDLTPDIRAHFWGGRRSYNSLTQHSLQWNGCTTGSVTDPRWQVSNEGWSGGWSTVGDPFADAPTDRWAYNSVDFLATNGLAQHGAYTYAVRYVDRDRNAPLNLNYADGRFGVAQAGAVTVNGRLPFMGDLPVMNTLFKGTTTPYASAELRSRFADNALWLAALETDEKGEASAEVTFPDNLTTWRVRALAMTRETGVGDASATAVTTKKLLVRLQAPRFFMERDRVVLTANVHNYLTRAKRAKVSLNVGDGCLALQGNAATEVEVPAGGEAKVDWEVAVRQEGSAEVAVEALTDEESDAAKLTFPVLVHGAERYAATAGCLEAGGPGTAEIKLEIPEERNLLASRLEVRLAPSLAVTVVDALPYLIDYPYGCTEQTMSRFLPAVLTQQALRKMG